jgi:uncharacterized membrane protein YebE (DUF533 family)
MNPIEILESILRGGAGAPGGGASGGRAPSGTDILTEIFGGSRPAPQTQSGSTRPSSGQGQVSAKDLEDMLGVNRGGAAPTSQRQQPQAQTQPQTRAPQQPQAQAPAGFPTDIFGQRRPEAKPSLAVARPAAPSQQEQAVLMIRAMINAAKVDGQITEDEQRFILQQVGDTSNETVQFLRTEFARPINVAEFVDSIPSGMEKQVYTLSLMAMQLDTKAEADYLRQLVKGLRLPLELVAELHTQQGVPPIYA